MTIGINKIKAIMDSRIRTNPLVLLLAYVIKKEENTIRPMATKEAHILSKLDMLDYSHSNNNEKNLTLIIA
jgi:hypothetical protein